MGSRETNAELERALEAAIDRLGTIDPTVETKALLIEARRLRRIVANWQSLPASDAAREAMAQHIALLVQNATAAAPSLPPPSTSELLAESLLSGLSLADPAVDIVSTQSLEWMPSATVPGVASKLLHWDADHGVFTAILQLAGGAELPPKRCATCSALYVLSGSLEVRAETLCAGCYCRFEPTGEEFGASTSTGCELLLIGSDRQELLG